MADELACDKCNALPFSRLRFRERVLSWICYQIAMVWPHIWYANKAHLVILPWAGTYGFSCHCPPVPNKGSR